MPLAPQERKAELIRRGITQASIAARLAVSTKAVSSVISGRHRSARIEEAVAEAIERKADDVFPPALRRRAAAA